MGVTQVQAALLKLLDSAHSAQREWVEELSDAQRNVVGTAEEWSVKDMLAHVTFWQQESAERLAAVRGGREPQLLGDFQQVNERVFEERRAQPWGQVLETAEQTHAALVEHVAALDDQSLTDPQRFAWTRGQPLTANILGNAFWHPLEHVARYYVASGQQERASQLLDRAVVQDEALATLPGDCGATLYNLACFYATTGQPDKALPLLPDALRLRPDLVEWSKQDSDLDTLREAPAFKALHGG
jgi:tetratricopeptide (TPR) repeat protein